MPPMSGVPWSQPPTVSKDKRALKFIQERVGTQRMREELSNVLAAASEDAAPSPVCNKACSGKKKKKLLGKEMDQPVIGDRNLRAGQRSAVFE